MNKRIDGFLKHNDYSNFTFEHVIYIKGLNKRNINIMYLYVGDILIIKSKHNGIENLKLYMNIEFDITDLRRIRYFLDLDKTKRSKKVHD